MPTPRCPDRELDVMAVLWARGPSTVAVVRAALAERGHGPADIAVLTVRRTLEVKGHVGRATAAQCAVRRRLGTMSGGSRERPPTRRVDARGADEAALGWLRALLHARLGGDAS